MFSKIFSIFFSTLFFFIKHFFLFIFCYLFHEFFMLRFVVNAFIGLNEKIASSLSVATGVRHSIKLDYLWYFAYVLSLSIKIGLYNIAIANDRNSLESDFILYMADFMSNAKTIIFNSLSFFFFLFLSSLTIVGGYFYINLYSYYSVFLLKTDRNGQNYSHMECLKEGRKLAKDFTKSLFALNTILVSFYMLLWYITPRNMIFNDINFTAIFKNMFVDCVIVHFIYVATKIDDINEEKRELEKQKEIANMEALIRGKSDV